MNSSDEYASLAATALERSQQAVSPDRINAYATRANAYAQLATAAAIREQTAAGRPIVIEQPSNRDGEWT